MIKYYIYAYLRSTTSKFGDIGSIYYIGKGSGKRAFEKHRIRIPKDKNNIVFLHEGIAEKLAFRYEEELIKKYGRIDLGTGCLRNLTNGGEGASGYRHTAETRQQISNSHKGKTYSDAYKKNMSISKKGTIPWNKGKIDILSEETKRKIGKSSKGRNIGRKHTLEELEKTRGENNHNFGKRRTLDVTQKISNSKKGTIWMKNPASNQIKFVRSKDLDLYLSLGFKRGKGK